jgi:hypothetical protein
MKITIEFETTGAMFVEDHEAAVARTINQAAYKLLTTYPWKLHPPSEALMDINGNTIGIVTVVER